MVSLHELTESIPQDTVCRQPLDAPRSTGTTENLQGNILQGHGRDRSVHIFLQFKLARRTMSRSGSRISLMLNALPLHSSNSMRLSSTDDIKFQVVCL